MSDRALAFFYTVLGVAGLSLLSLQLHLFHQLWSSRDWVATPAAVLSVEQQTVRSSGTGNLRERPLQRIQTRYRYVWEGRGFEGDRLEFWHGADNFSSQRRNRQMRALAEWNQQVFVNPRDPSESVYDRSAPIERMALVSLFILVPCSPGILFLLGLAGKLASRRLDDESAAARIIARSMSWLKLGVLVVCPLYALIFLSGSLTPGSAAVFVFIVAVALAARLFLAWLEQIVPSRPLDRAPARFVEPRHLWQAPSLPHGRPSAPRRSGLRHDPGPTSSL